MLDSLYADLGELGTVMDLLDALADEMLAKMDDQNRVAVSPGSARAILPEVMEFDIPSRTNPSCSMKLWMAI